MNVLNFLLNIFFPSSDDLCTENRNEIQDVHAGLSSLKLILLCKKGL